MSESPEITVADAHDYIKTRFFGGQDARETWPEAGAIFGRLCRDAGFVRRSGEIALPGEFCSHDPDADPYGDMVRCLASGETRSAATYAHRGPARKTSAGTAPLLTIDRHQFHALVDALDSEFIRKGKQPALPREQPAGKPVPGRASLRYPDEEGALKAAFCKGLGIDPGRTAMGFVELFRSLVYDSVLGVRGRGCSDFRNLHGRSLAALVVYAKRGLDPRNRYEDDSIRADAESMARTLNTVLLDRKVKGPSTALMDTALAELCGKTIATEAPEIVETFRQGKYQASRWKAAPGMMR